MKIRTWQELVRYETFEERYRYLKLDGEVGKETFGHERYLNQRFYTSREWRNLRHHVIARDLARDLALEGYDLHEKIIVHHMNPMMVEDLLEGNEDVLNPDYLISVSHRTHNAIHFGDDKHLLDQVVTRRPGDTRLW